MAAVTERIRFLTNVIKLPIRDPLLVAKQLSPMAVLANDRVGLGVGLRWMPEEFRYTHTDMKTRGKRADEMIDILRLVCGGGGPKWVEYHGKHYDFDRLMISPAPEQPVPISVQSTADRPFEINALSIDGFDVDGCRRLADAGVTELQAVPWYFSGGDPNDLQVQIDSLPRFADEVIARF